jgi:hypothetical protein
MTPGGRRPPLLLRTPQAVQLQGHSLLLKLHLLLQQLGLLVCTRQVEGMLWRPQPSSWHTSRHLWWVLEQQQWRRWVVGVWTSLWPCWGVAGRRLRS